MTSRNRTEGRYIGHGYGRAVRKRIRSGWPVSADIARAFLRGRWARQHAHRICIPLVISHMADQQGAQ